MHLISQQHENGISYGTAVSARGVSYRWGARGGKVLWTDREVIYRGRRFWRHMRTVPPALKTCLSGGALNRGVVTDPVTDLLHQARWIL